MWVRVRRVAGLSGCDVYVYFFLLQIISHAGDACLVTPIMYVAMPLLTKDTLLHPHEAISFFVTGASVSMR